MKKEFVLDGNYLVVVEDGAIYMNGTKVANSLEASQVIPAKQAPKAVVDKAVAKGIDLTDRVYLDKVNYPVLTFPYIAEEAVRQTLEMRKAAEAQSPENVIPGYTELVKAYEGEAQYQRGFNKMVGDEYNDGIRPPKKPQVNIEELKQKYPQAAAYLKAEGYTDSSNDRKRAAGKKALPRILAGEDPATVIQEMEAEWRRAATGSID